MTLREGSSLYYATRQLTTETRERVTVVLVLFDTLANAVTDVQEPQVAEKKIHWWHEEIQRLYNKEARHPHTKNVESWLNDYCPDPAPLLSILTVNNQLRFMNTDTSEAFRQQLKDDYGSRLTIVNSVLDQSIQPNDPSTACPSWASPFAVGLGAVDKLNNLNKLHFHGHMVFAEESWQTAGLTPEQALDPQKKEALERLIQAIIRLAAEQLDEATSALEQVPKTILKPLWILTALRQQQLALWQRENHNPLTASMSLTPASKAWRAWRTASKADRLLKQ